MFVCACKNRNTSGFWPEFWRFSSPWSPATCGINEGKKCWFAREKERATCKGRGVPRRTDYALAACQGEVCRELSLDKTPGFALRAPPWQSSFAKKAANEDWSNRLAKNAAKAGARMQLKLIQVVTIHETLENRYISLSFIEFR